MHDNENTATTATRKLIDEQGGRLIELQHKGTRYISFSVNGKNYQIDPNRIFSDVGIRNNLTDLNGNYAEEAFVTVQTFAQKLLNQFILSNNKRDIVAVHNNTNKNWDINSFRSEATQIHIQQGADLDDFFLVTDKNDFDRLQKKRFNVVLQSQKKVADDGSLSVYCGKNKIRYINVEAQDMHADEQFKMLKAL